tara:strand:- start:3273 stop:3893 length:621 start_codon:yes stop_codon:yes gene_type:complete
MKYNCKLGIGLIPRDQERIYQLVETIDSNFGLGFKTEPGVSIPHITLFQGRFKEEESVNEVVRVLDIADLSLDSVGVGIDIWARKILFLNIDKTKELSRLHYETFARVFPLCAGKPADAQNLVGISLEQRKSLDATGFPFTGSLYLPHFTLAHLDIVPRGSCLEDLNGISKPYLAKPFKFDKLVTYEAGKFGACKKVLYERLIDEY